MDKDKIQLVKNGCNQIGEAYARDRATFGSEKYICQLMKLVRPGSTILDIGCGDGVPIDKILLKNRFQVVGMDFSEKRIGRARLNCPAGVYVARDLMSLRQNEMEVEGVVCLDTMFQVPRAKQGERSKVLSSDLPRGGICLIRMGDSDFEGVTKFHGVSRWWSQWRSKTNRELMEKAGFKMIIDETDQKGGE